MILPEKRWMWEGIEGADSVVVNVHKWLGVAFDCSLYYVKDPEHLVRVMSTNPSYLPEAASTIASTTCATGASPWAGAFARSSCGSCSASRAWRASSGGCAATSTTRPGSRRRVRAPRRGGGCWRR